MRAVQRERYGCHSTYMYVPQDPTCKFHAQPQLQPKTADGSLWSHAAVERTSVRAYNRADAESAAKCLSRDALSETLTIRWPSQRLAWRRGQANRWMNWQLFESFGMGEVAVDEATGDVVSAALCVGGGELTAWRMLTGLPIMYSNEPRTSLSFVPHRVTPTDVVTREANPIETWRWKTNAHSRRARTKPRLRAGRP